MTRNKLTKKLKAGIVFVHFTKQDGTPRSMWCTRNLKDIPKRFHPKHHGPTKRDLVNVFDIGSRGWRTFHFSRLKSVLYLVKTKKLFVYELCGWK